MLASEVMDRASALLNDVGLTNFTYEVQIPFLNIALDELQESLEQNNVGVTNSTSAIYTIAAGTFDIGGAGPALPADLVEIQALYERDSGTTDDFMMMSRTEFLPQIQVLTQWLTYWTWENQIIKFVGAISNRNVKIQYIANNIIPVTTSTSVITIINAKSFLAYRTAALCAEFIGENKSRADDLNVDASLAIDRMLGINTKGRQSITIRRRPFMASYKSRGYL